MSNMSEFECILKLIKNKDYSDETFKLALKNEQNLEALRVALKDKDDELEMCEYRYKTLYNRIENCLDELRDIVDYD
jgi:hypothetical protein